MPYYVGQFVMTWAKHERMLADMLARVRGCEYEPLRDRFLDDQVAAYEKEMRKTLAEIGGAHPSAPYLQIVIDKHVSLRSIRHKIVHGFWLGIGPDDEYVLKRKPRKEEDTSRTLPLDEIESAWQRLDALGCDVLNVGFAAQGKPII